MLFFLWSIVSLVQAQTGMESMLASMASASQALGDVTLQVDVSTSFPGMVAGLVGGGFPNTYLIDLAANLALPPRVTELPVFMASKSNMKFASSFAPANPSVVQVSLQTAAGEKAAGGILPESRPTKANYDLHFECLSSGVTSIVWTLSVPQVDQKLDIVLLKQCGVTKPLPAFCSQGAEFDFSLSPTTPKSKVDIASLNAWGISKIAPERRAGIVQHLKTADVVALQEVFSSEDKAAIRTALTEANPDFKYFLVEGLTDPEADNNSGLFFASKLPIVQCAFTKYTAAAGTDAAAAKGAGSILVHQGGNRLLLVVNTHLQAGAAYALARNLQVVQLKTFVEERTKKAAKTSLGTDIELAVTLVGDLNINAKGADNLMATLGPSMDHLLSGSADPGTCTDPQAKTAPCTVGSQGRNRVHTDLDYAILFNQPDQPSDLRASASRAIACCDGDDLSVSDHPLVTLSLSTDSPNRPTLGKAMSHSSCKTLHYMVVAQALEQKFCVAGNGLAECDSRNKQDQPLPVVALASTSSPALLQHTDGTAVVGEGFALQRAAGKFFRFRNKAGKCAHVNQQKKIVPAKCNSKAMRQKFVIVPLF